MQVKDLDGNSTTWHLTGNISKGRLEGKSSLHLRARKLLKDLYPTMQILEEVSIPLRRSEVLYLDFYIPLIRRCIETHGEQHYAFVAHYHPNRLSFLKSQKRDKEKKTWCEINGITYIDLPYNQNDEEWLNRINL
jgi:hypothetical protein